MSHVEHESLRPWEKKCPALDEVKVAIEWKTQHEEHVKELLDETEGCYQPTAKIDCANPALWKGEHWRWLETWGKKYPLFKTCQIETTTGLRKLVEVTGYTHRNGGSPEFGSLDGEDDTFDHTNSKIL